MQNIPLGDKVAKSEIEQMKFETGNKSPDVKGNSLHHDFVTIVSSFNKTCTYVLFKNWCLTSSTIIRCYLTLAAKSPSFYNDIRCDGNSKTNFLMLPSRRRLRDYKSYIHSTQGLNHDVINELLKMLITFYKKINICLPFIRWNDNPGRFGMG